MKNNVILTRNHTLLFSENATLLFSESATLLFSENDAYFFLLTPRPIDLNNAHFITKNHISPTS